MLGEHNKRDTVHLINLIGRRSQNVPNFSLLIGAGVSTSSGVKTATQMIAEWRRQLYEQSKSDESFEEWLKKQDYYKDEEEYAILFEKVCDQRSQRRIYIEKCVKNANPSWGYVYLCNMIAHNYFNVIFTPNFDDLLNEACFLYTDLKPVVCAHDSAVIDIRVTSTQPKIIKLHGDFLYESIRDAIREMRDFESNMREKFMQFAREYGLVVIGYGGNDRSIMSILQMLLRSEEYFPQGVYWCIQSKSRVNKKVKRLMREKNIYWVEIEGFDEFMAELHEMLGLQLPDVLLNPYEAAIKRMNRILLPVKEVTHTIIKKDVTKVIEQARKFGQAISEKDPRKEPTESVSYLLLGDIEYMNRNYEKALNYYEKASIQNPVDLEIMDQMVLCYLWTERFNEALEMSEKMISYVPDDWRGYRQKGNSLLCLNMIEDSIASYDEALECINKKLIADILTSRSNALLILRNWKEALVDVEKSLQIEPESYVTLISKCIALKKLGRKEETERILQDILHESDDKYIRACAFAVLGEKENMLKELKTEIEEDSGKRVDAKIDPDFADYRDDPDFRDLVYKKE